jgi:hypothetical protein
MNSADLTNMFTNRAKINQDRKEAWVNSQLQEFQGCRKDVIEFIADITGYNTTVLDGGEAIEELFSSGYCYYFALMLKDAFGGEICWHKNYSHIL